MGKLLYAQESERNKNDMTDRNNLVADLRRTAETMRELGDLAKADLLNRAADYIEEKHLQTDADEKLLSLKERLRSKE